MSTFDPFAATWDEAAAHPDPMAVARWGAAQRLMLGRDRFEADPMAGMYLCAQYALAIPDWLGAAFCAAFERVGRAEVGSWDDAFGAPWPKGTRLALVQSHDRRRLGIFLDVIQALARDPSTPLDAALFERIGRTHGAGRTLARQLYSEACARYGYGGAKTKRAITKSRVCLPASFRKLAAIPRRR